MIDITMPDNRRLQFAHVVFDYNGTLAEDGITSETVKALLKQLAEKVHVAVITADTFGLVREQLKDLKNIDVIVIGSDVDGKGKARYVREWGAETTVVVGNGVNDQPMFFIGALKIAVLGPEGVSSGLLAAASIVVKSPEDAIRLLLNPKRLIATLRY